MSDQTRRPDDADLRQTAENARRLAEDASHDARLEQPTAAGAGGHPHPDIAAADHLRARDDVDTFERQADLAETQAEAAETLRRNRELLAGGREALDEVRAEVAENRADIRELADDTRDLRGQVQQARDAVRDTPTPDVDAGSGDNR
jgi:seryl-tRNA synthetase